MRPTPEEVREWMSQDLTGRIMALVREERQNWVEQSCVGRQASDSHRLASFRDGVIAGLGFVLDLGKEDEEARESNAHTKPGRQGT